VYEALTGEKPFAAEYLPTLLYKIVREDPLPPQRLNNTLSPHVETILRKALAKLPEDRFGTCTDFITSLAAACNINPGWTPLPRGTSPNMPTAGSHGDLAETIADTRPPAAIPVDADATRIIPPSPAPPPPVPVRALERASEPSHTLRNVLLGVATAAVLGIVMFVATQKPQIQEVQPQVPPSAPAVATAAPAQPVEAAPPPEAAAAEPNQPQPVATAPRSPAAPSEGSFALTTSPAGATVSFDTSGIECTTPCNLTLPAGRHTFVLRHAGFRETQKIITIPNDTGLIVDLVPTSGTLNLISNPPGLSVLIDGREQTQKTPLSVALPVGPHKVELVKGTERQEFQVDLSDGQFVSKTISWQ
jgi:hypothetical protein